MASPLVIESPVVESAAPGCRSNGVRGGSESLGYRPLSGTLSRFGADSISLRSLVPVPDSDDPRRVYAPEYTHRCVVLHAARLILAVDILTVLEAAMALDGAPECLRSDNGPESTAYAIQDGFGKASIKTISMQLKAHRLHNVAPFSYT